MTEPATYVIRGNNPGEISFTLCVADNGDQRRVHLDCYDEKQNIPYGHISLGHIKSIISWLKKAEKWIESMDKL